MATKDNAHKDAEMAQRLKAEGVRRVTGNCPLCHKRVPNGGGHIAGLKCQGPTRKGTPGKGA